MFILHTMSADKNIFIGIGSNSGDRHYFLQAAVDLIHLEVGSIKLISSIYETPALGFNGADFLNACLKVRTRLKPTTIMKKLLGIEKRLGRTRKEDGAYHSRTVDLDFLFCEDLVTKSNQLTLPHPRISERKFVLQPLNDIAQSFEHPVLNISIQNLLDNCTDQSAITPIPLKLKNPLRKYKFDQIGFLAIEGNIGSGKTSLAKYIAEDFNAKLLLERFADNPFLPKFYKDPKRYAFVLEMAFLADRYQQISEDLAQLDLFKDLMVSDYDIFKSLIFSKVTLNEEEFKLYRTLFYQVYKDIKRPDLYVYLHQNIDALVANIENRGRSFEQTIAPAYLKQISDGYLEFIKNSPELKVKVIDMSGRDFVNNRSDYLWVLEQIKS